METITDRNSICTIIRDRPEQLKGFTVCTIDGEAGRVADHQSDVDEAHLVVHLDTMLGLLGKDVVIEAEAVDRIEPEHRQIHIDRISDWVKSSPKLGALTA